MLYYLIYFIRVIHGSLLYPQRLYFTVQPRTLHYIEMRARPRFLRKKLNFCLVMLFGGKCEKYEKEYGV